MFTNEFGPSQEDSITSNKLQLSLSMFVEFALGSVELKDSEVVELTDKVVPSYCPFVEEDFAPAEKLRMGSMESVVLFKSVPVAAVLRTDVDE